MNWISIFLNEKIKLIFSDELLSEFLSVTGRPKLKRFFSETGLKHLLRLIKKNYFSISLFNKERITSTLSGHGCHLRMP